jgi:hypothetical protein
MKHVRFQFLLLTDNAYSNELDMIEAIFSVKSSEFVRAR